MRRQLASQQVSVEVVTVVGMVVAVDSVGHVGSGMCEWQERTFPHVLRMVVILMFAMIRPHHGSISVNLGDARLVLKIFCGLHKTFLFYASGDTIMKIYGHTRQEPRNLVMITNTYDFSTFE